MKCKHCKAELRESFIDADGLYAYWIHPGAAWLEVCLMKQGIIKKLAVREGESEISAGKEIIKDSIIEMLDEKER